MGSINQRFIQQHTQIMSYQKIFLATATILLLAVSSQAFKISTRDYCPPKPTTMSTFNATQFLGNWYQVNGLPAFFSPEGTTCIRATYGAMDYGKVSVRNVDFNPAGKFDEICGYADVPNPDYPAELLVHFPFAPASDYWILETDYDNFASVYTCVDFFGIIKAEFAWVLVRDPNNVTYEIMNQALNAYKSQGLSTEAFYLYLMKVAPMKILLEQIHALVEAGDDNSSS